MCSCASAHLGWEHVGDRTGPHSCPVLPGVLLDAPRVHWCRTGSSHAVGFATQSLCAGLSCPSSGYLEEDEDVEEEGLAEDLQETQRQRMLGGRGRCVRLAVWARTPVAAGTM